jgi:uncharacterized protein YndB with AHSA1/START domain
VNKFAYVALGFVLVVAIVLSYAATRPSRYEIRRETTIAAPVSVVYPLIADLHNWPRWAPQDREDATMRRTFEGAASGVGAQSTWQSTGTAGAGSMEIVEAVPDKLVRVQVDWTKPFETRNVNTFELKAEGQSTQVIWAMEGQNLFPLKVMSVFVNLDRMLGRHFEKGLKDLKSAAEAK